MVKLLIADDEQKICRLLGSFFADRGFQIEIAHDGKEALACIRKERPHLVFLDLSMPGTNGMDVLKETRQIDETIKIIVITAVEDEEMIKQAKALGAADYLVKPFSLEYLKDEVLAKVSTSLYEDLRAANQELQRSLEQMRQVTRGIVSAFSLVVSKIDPHYTHEHVSRSVEYAGKIIDKLKAMGVLLEGMPEEVLLAGILLHDVGKIFTPKEILFKPGPLTDEEWRIMRRHPVDGAEILEEISGLKQMAQIVRYHQEAYDGSGYPEGLKGEQIPIGARIATVVDAFDAMITDRPYRKGMGVAWAIEELKRNRGTQFDPQVVDAIVTLYEEGNLKPVHLPDPAQGQAENGGEGRRVASDDHRGSTNHRAASRPSASREGRLPSIQPGRTGQPSRPGRPSVSRTDPEAGVPLQSKPDPETA